MAFRHPVRNDFDRVFRALSGQLSQRNLDGAVARANIKLLRVYTEIIEAERDAETPGQHFLHAMVSALANQLAATLKFTIERGEQLAALPAVFDTLREQIEPRLDKEPTAPVLFAGFSTQKRTHRKGETDPVLTDNN